VGRDLCHLDVSRDDPKRGTHLACAITSVLNWVKAGRRKSLVMIRVETFRCGFGRRRRDKRVAAF
jgi:hypothetical protein